MHKHLTLLAAVLISLSYVGGCTYSKSGPDTQTEGQVSPDSTTGQTTGPKLPDAPGTAPTGETGPTGPTGEVRWTKFLSSDGEDKATAMAISSNGEIVVVGSTKGDLTPDDGKPNADELDLFVAKITADGNLAWIDQRGTAGNDEAKGVAIDGGGNIYVTGYTEGKLDDVQNGAGKDVFLIKYTNSNSSAERSWTVIHGSEQDDIGNDVAFDETGGLWVAGESNHNEAAATVGKNAIVWKFNPADGAFIPDMAVTMGTTEDDVANALLVSPDNLGVAGTTKGTLGTVAPYNSWLGETDLFIAFFNPTSAPPAPGIIQPQSPSNSDKDDIAFRLATGGNMTYVGGWTTRNPVASAAPDGFVAQIGDPTKPLPTAVVMSLDKDYLYGVAVDPTDPAGQKVYAVGQTFGFLLPGASSEGLGAGDLFVVKFDFAKFDPNNPATYIAPDWSKQEGTPEEDQANDVVVDAAGNVYVVGSTAGNLDGHTNLGGTDVFLRKYNSDGVLQ